MDILKSMELMEDSKGVRVEEASAIFLYIVVGPCGKLHTADRFQQSLETIS